MPDVEYLRQGIAQVEGWRGQPEPLKYELVSYWSRRIDLANRLVYKPGGDRIYIVQCGTHYHKTK